MLAAAAPSTVSAGDCPTIYVKPGSGGLNKPGPFNPAATLAPKVAKKILELDFVEMAEVKPTPGRQFKPNQPSQWMERFATMAALLSQRFPTKAPELFAYLATFVRAERNYEAGCWAA